MSGTDHIHKFICKNFEFENYEDYVTEYNEMVEFEKNCKEDFSLYTVQMEEDERRIEIILEECDNYNDNDYYD